MDKKVYEDLSAESEKFSELVEMQAINQEQHIMRSRQELSRRHSVAPPTLGLIDGKAKATVKQEKPNGWRNVKAMTRVVGLASRLKTSSMRNLGIKTEKAPKKIHPDEEEDGDDVDS